MKQRTMLQPRIFFQEPWNCLALASSSSGEHSLPECFALGTVRGSTCCCLHMQGQASSGQQGREAGRLMLSHSMAFMIMSQKQ